MCDWLLSPDGLELAAQVSFVEYSDFAGAFLLMFLANVHSVEASTSAAKCLCGPARRCIRLVLVEFHTSRE